MVIILLVFVIRVLALELVLCSQWSCWLLALLMVAFTCPELVVAAGACLGVACDACVSEGFQIADSWGLSSFGRMDFSLA